MSVLVSAVIPTYRRPSDVVRAVRSALEQTYEQLEVIVVVDGPHEPTSEALAAIDDERLRVVVLDENVGNAEARNVGIANARGDYVALLDDDDLWMPDKIARQVALAEASALRWPIVSCRLRATNETQTFVWPRRLPEADQPICEYLFCRRTPSTGEGMVQTSTVLAPTALFREVVFQRGLKRYVDVDWVLRAARRPEVGLVFVDSEAPLSVWRIEEGRKRITTGADWRWDLDWIRERRALVTPRAYAAFVLTLPSVRAARDGDRSAFRALLEEALRAARPSAGELAYHVGNFAAPMGLRRRLAGLVARRRRVVRE